MISMLKYRSRFLFSCIVVTIMLMLCSFQKDTTVKKPNIILIIADDLGYSDLASYGNTFVHTPHIDALGQSGIRFTEAYTSAPICGPSRQGILTGRYQQRFGDEFMPYDKYDIYFSKNIRAHYAALKKSIPGLNNAKPNFFINRKNFNDGLPANEITLAEFLRRQGYATGLVGKWNLGDGVQYFPGDHGYGYSYYFEGALTRYVDDPVDTTQYINQHLPWAFSELVAWTPRSGSSAIREGKNIVKDTGYLTFSLASRAIDFIDRNKDSAFFLTLAFTAPHDPFQVPKAYYNRIQNVEDSVKRVYYGMIEALDDAVGSVMQKLEQEALMNNTLIFFLSDNGGATYTKATNNEPLRGGKCTHFEGGLTVPFFMSYPALLNGNMVYDKPISSLDIFSTIAAITETPLPGDRVYDGVNLLPFLTDKMGSMPHKVFYWRNGYSKAIRNGQWKLYINKKSKKTYLFNLDNDQQEKHDLSKQYPGKVNELKQQLQDWEDDNFIKPRWKSNADVLIDVDGEMIWFPT